MPGCTKPPEPVVKYTIPKHSAIQIPIEHAGAKDTPSAESTEPAPKTPKRTLVALILDKDVAWFIKALAPPGDFPEDVGEAFDGLLKSLKFEAPDKPSWELGEKWVERPGGGMRVANLMLDQLEFSVIRLPMRSPDEPTYILDNVNRWRGELDLPAITMDELPSNGRKVVTSDGHDALVLDLEGMRGDSTMGRPMAGARGPMAGARRPSPPNSSPNAPFESKPPTAWKTAKPGMMQLAKFTIDADGKTANVSVSRAGGDVFQNINRWRSQVGLKPLTEASEMKNESITVNDQPAMLAELFGENGRSIVIAMLPADKPTWFFKLMGDTEAVKSNSAAFREYLNTIKLRN